MRQYGLKQYLRMHIPKFLQNAIFGLSLFAIASLKKVRNRAGYYSLFSRTQSQKSSRPKPSILKELGYIWKHVLFVAMRRVSLSMCFSLSVYANPISLIFWHSMAGELGEEVRRLAQQFNESQTEYQVKAIYKGDYMESLTSFAAAFRAKHPPNLIQIAEVGTSVMLSPKGIVKPYESLMHEQDMAASIERFFPAVRENYSLNGQLMAMPFNVSVPIMFYNADLLAQFGVTQNAFPKTWDELEVLAKRLHDAGMVCTYASAYPAWILIESYRALHGLLAQDMPQSIALHIKRIRRWQLMHYFEYGGRADDATVLFTSGKCPIFSQSSGGYASLSKLVPFRLGIAPMPLDSPTDRHHNVVGGASLWIVAGQTKEMERGIALYLTFLSKPEIQQAWYEHTGYLPLNLKNAVESTTNAYCTDCSTDFDDFLLHRMGDTFSAKNHQNLSNNQYISHSRYDSTAFFRLNNMKQMSPTNQGLSILDIAALDLNQNNMISQHVQQGPANQIRSINDQMLEAIFSGMMDADDAINKAGIRIEHVLQRFKKNTHTES